MPCSKCEGEGHNARTCHASKHRKGRVDGRRNKSNGEKAKKGGMTVAEAGRKGGQTVRDERGHEFYVEIGRKGGETVKALIEAGRKALGYGTR